jgi:hypothetical protein
VKFKGHLQSFNHFNFVAGDTLLFKKSWEEAFNIDVPEIFPITNKKGELVWPPEMQKPLTYKGKKLELEDINVKSSPSVPPIYQPKNRMIEVKGPGSLPTVNKTYMKFGNCIQYFGIVEGNNKKNFLADLKDEYGCEILEEMYFSPLPGDFCFVETESLLGFNLCVKEDGALNGLVKTVLPSTTECTIITPNIEKSVRDWENIFDIKDPKINQIKVKYRFQNKHKIGNLKIARIDETPFTLFLVEDKNSGPFSEFSKKYIYGIHHISFDMGDRCIKFVNHMKTKLNIDVLEEYDIEGIHYYLFDSTQKMGGYIAVRDV